MERWEAAIKDYEMLLKELPGNEDVCKALSEAQIQLKIMRGEDVQDFKLACNLINISSNDRFQHYVSSLGKSKFHYFA